MKIDGFDWDTANFEKVQKHGLSIEEIELFFEQDILVVDDQKHSQSEKRQIAVGQLKDRVLFVAFTIRRKLGRHYLRVISARCCHQKEQKYYEELKKKK
ncbi:MAG: BrnT family toxin [Pseudomonadota bacterium]